MFRYYTNSYKIEPKLSEYIKKTTYESIERIKEKYKLFHVKNDAFELYRNDSMESLDILYNNEPIHKKEKKPNYLAIITSLVFFVAVNTFRKCVKRIV